MERIDGKAPAEVEVWRVEVATALEPDPETLAVLTDQERVRLASFLRRDDRARFATVRAALRRRLGTLLGAPAETVPIVSGARGKPRLPGDEIWFNVSHSGGQGLIALSGSGAVGVDVEATDRPLEDGVERLALSPRERAAWAAADGQARAASFFRSWVAKEAILKAAGLGLAGGLLALRLRETDGGFAVDGDAVELGFDPAAVAVAALPAPPGYAAAIAWTRAGLNGAGGAT